MAVGEPADGDRCRRRAEARVAQRGRAVGAGGGVAGDRGAVVGGCRVGDDDLAVARSDGGLRRRVGQAEEDGSRGLRCGARTVAVGRGDRARVVLAVLQRRDGDRGRGRARERVGPGRATVVRAARRAVAGDRVAVVGGCRVGDDDLAVAADDGGSRRRARSARNQDGCRRRRRGARPDAVRGRRGARVVRAVGQRRDDDGRRARTEGRVAARGAAVARRAVRGVAGDRAAVVHGRGADADGDLRAGGRHSGRGGRVGKAGDEHGVRRGRRVARTRAVSRGDGARVVAAIGEAGDGDRRHAAVGRRVVVRALGAAVAGDAIRVVVRDRPGAAVVRLGVGHDDLAVAAHRARLRGRVGVRPPGCRESRDDE